jgi:hypothetical protein
MSKAGIAVRAGAVVVAVLHELHVGPRPRVHSTCHC